MIDRAARVIAGVDLRSVHVHDDARGDLLAFDDGENLPFTLRRVFLLRAGDGGAARGGHANSCHELIVAVSGAVSVEVDNGWERGRVRLRARERALWIRPGIVIHLRAFEPRTVLLVCASASYGDTRHFDRPQPQLIPADCAA